MNNIKLSTDTVKYRVIPSDFKPPTIKNTKDVTNLTGLENFLYSPNEVSVIRKNHIAEQKKKFEYQYKRSLKDAITISAFAFSIPVALSFYVNKKGFSDKKSALIIVSPIILSGVLYFLTPKWS